MTCLTVRMKGLHFMKFKIFGRWICALGLFSASMDYAEGKAKFVTGSDYAPYADEALPGGGLFTETGLLIGVCNAADEKGNEGLYAALASVHWQLDQIGQSAIYKKNDAAPTNIAAPAHEPVITPVAATAPTAPPLMPAAMPSGIPLAMSATAPAKAGTPTDDDTEVIVIVRSKSNPAKQSDIFVMDRPPTEIIRQLQVAGRPAPRGSSQDLLRSATQFNATDGSPIIRGQSQP